MIKFPEYATRTLIRIIENGYEAYFVGGCVRDGLLGKKCDDIDITTSAKPAEIMSIFSNTKPTGIKHGTVTVIEDGHPIEVTTYRSENAYSDNRHPENVSFISSVHEDLARRDFTVNALAYSIDGELVDKFGGLKDLENRIIRAVGDPVERFSEDALRILRAYRFASVLDFEIEPDTAKAAVFLSPNIQKISGERVLKELTKAADGIRPSAVCKLLNTCSLDYFGLGSAKHENSVIDKLTTTALDINSKTALLISLCHHDTELIWAKLKASNTLYNNLVCLDKLTCSPIPSTKTELKHLMFRFDCQITKLYLHYLDITEKPDIKQLYIWFYDILESGEPYKISQLAISGKDLEENGFKGKEIGNALEKVLLQILDNKLKNKKEDILSFIKN